MCHNSKFQCDRIHTVIFLSVAQTLRFLFAKEILVSPFLRFQSKHDVFCRACSTVVLVETITDRQAERPAQRYEQCFAQIHWIWTCRSAAQWKINVWQWLVWSRSQIRVPRPAVGVIIGKGGDMIKKIQQDSGARVQFTPDDGHSADRTCSITGPGDRVQQAVNMIQDLIQSTAVSEQASCDTKPHSNSSKLGDVHRLVFSVLKGHLGKNKTPNEIFLERTNGTRARAWSRWRWQIWRPRSRRTQESWLQRRTGLWRLDHIRCSIRQMRTCNWQRYFTRFVETKWISRESRHQWSRIVRPGIRCIFVHCTSLEPCWTPHDNRVSTSATVTRGFADATRVYAPCVEFDSRPLHNLHLLYCVLVLLPNKLWSIQPKFHIWGDQVTLFCRQNWAS